MRDRRSHCKSTAGRPQGRGKRASRQPTGPAFPHPNAPTASVRTRDPKSRAGVLFSLYLPFSTGTVSAGPRKGYAATSCGTGSERLGDLAHRVTFICVYERSFQCACQAYRNGLPGMGTLRPMRRCEQGEGVSRLARVGLAVAACLVVANCASSDKIARRLDPKYGVASVSTRGRAGRTGAQGRRHLSRRQALCGRRPDLCARGGQQLSARKAWPPGTATTSMAAGPPTAKSTT